jgi:cysteinyl-tRNA synthetase
VQIRLTNSLTRQKEPLRTLEPGKLGLYVCGVTVYDFSHVGHARVYIIFDVVQRTARRMGFDVKYVRNFTDVDDKIINRANQNGETTEALTNRMIAAFHEDMDRLDCERPQIEPRVTTHMPEIVAMIEQIIARGHAYVVAGETQPNGSEAQDVYFDVKTFPPYGALSGRSQEDNTDGASERVQHDVRKHSQADFALWKSAKPGEPFWNSPWGRGRPGWHIECSAMACKHLGETFDVHCGGKDLVFPHHENEIAQARAANSQEFARQWMHNGFVTIDSEKMSKSLGNFFTIRDVLARFHPQVLRYFLLTAHYTHPLNFSDRSLEEAQKRVLAIYEKLAAAEALLKARGITSGGVMDEPLLDVVERARAELQDALCDDFNTPKALAALSEPINALAAALDKPKAAGAIEVVAQVRAFIREASGWLGLFQHPPTEVVEQIVAQARDRLFPAGSEALANVERLLVERQEARAAKDWKRADEVRDALTQVGAEVRDTPQGTVWRPKLTE